MPLDDAALLEPFDYLCQQPGKNIRSQMVEAFNVWLKVPEDKLATIKTVVEMLHNASLLYGKEQRGKVITHEGINIASTTSRTTQSCDAACLWRTKSSAHRSRSTAQTLSTFWRWKRCWNWATARQRASAQVCVRA